MIAGQPVGARRGRESRNRRARIAVASCVSFSVSAISSVEITVIAPGILSTALAARLPVVTVMVSTVCLSLVSSDAVFATSDFAASCAKAPVAIVAQSSADSVAATVHLILGIALLQTSL